MPASLADDRSRSVTFLRFAALPHDGFEPEAETVWCLGARSLYHHRLEKLQSHVAMQQGDLPFMPVAEEANADRTQT